MENLIHFTFKIFESEDSKMEQKNLKDVILFDEEFPPSSLHFPCIMRIIRSGSYAERTNAYNSDIDNIYEVGPGLVSDDETSNNDFYLEKTDHDGFYRVKDRNGNYIYPRLLQIQAGSLLHGQKNIINDVETKASVEKDGEDQVLALRLHTWPVDVYETHQK